MEYLTFNSQTEAIEADNLISQAMGLPDENKGQRWCEPMLLNFEDGEKWCIVPPYNEHLELINGGVLQVVKTQLVE